MNGTTHNGILRNHKVVTLATGDTALSEEDKIERIGKLFGMIMQTLGLDLSDESLRDTPRRVAKMFVGELFSGLDEKNKPVIRLFENKYGYRQMLVEKDITLYSTCEHHFVPIIGKVHVGYIPRGGLIGLSKINRLVQYHARRPQVQERLTVQIAEGLSEALQHNDVAVMIEADHLCVKARGIEDTGSSTVTSHFSGHFGNEVLRREFLTAIRTKHQ